MEVQPRYEWRDYLLQHPGLFVFIVLAIVGLIVLSMMVPIWVDDHKRRKQDRLAKGPRSTAT